MPDNELWPLISDLQRIAGVIEGVACAVDGGAASCLVDMVESIDMVIAKLQDQMQGESDG